MKKILSIFLVLLFAVSVSAQSLRIDPSDGSTLDLRGGAGSKSVETFAYVYGSSGNPVSGVPVQCVLSYPDASTTSTKTKNSNNYGWATFTWRVYQSGVYGLNCSATVEGILVSDSVSFTVIL